MNEFEEIFFWTCFIMAQTFPQSNQIHEYINQHKDAENLNQHQRFEYFKNFNETLTDLLKNHCRKMETKRYNDRIIR
jgi:quinol monooxygenase YgiN